MKCIILIAILSVAAATCVPAFADTVHSYLVLRDTPVRSGPGAGYDDVTTLLKGDSVISTGSFGGRGIARGADPVCVSSWCFVMANGHYGYVPSGTYSRIQATVSPSD